MVNCHAGSVGTARRLIHLELRGVRNSIRFRYSAELYATAGPTAYHGRGVSDSEDRTVAEPRHGLGRSGVRAKSAAVRRSREGYLETIPDLVIEVRSKNDTRAELERIAASSLRASSSC